MRQNFRHKQTENQDEIQGVENTLQRSGDDFGANEWVSIVREISVGSMSRFGYDSGGPI